MRVYFDNAATTPIEPRVAEAMHDVMLNYFGNPSSIHEEGRKARSLIEKARKTVATLLGVSPGEIFFTSGGTEADNMAISCSVRDLGVTHIITSRIEHHAVLHSVENCEKHHKALLSYVNLHPNGQVDLAHLESLLQDTSKGKTLVTLMHANNELGNLIDLDKVGDLCKNYGAYFHSDTVQTMGHLPIDIKKSNIQYLSAAAHKFNGPKGVGFIYIHNDMKIKPFIAGGAQERNMRGGTENIIGIIGLAKALEIAYEEMDEQKQKVGAIRQYMKEQLQENIPGIVFNGDHDGAFSYTVLNAAIPAGLDAEMLLFNLDINGIAASGGSACTSGSQQSSHVIKEIKTLENSLPVRFSFGKYNTKDEVDYTIQKLRTILKLDKVAQTA